MHRYINKRDDRPIVLYLAASLSLSFFLVSYRRLNGGISDKITRKALETTPCLFYLLIQPDQFQSGTNTKSSLQEVVEWLAEANQNGNS
jgi:hypothetical protein